MPDALVLEGDELLEALVLEDDELLEALVSRRTTTRYLDSYVPVPGTGSAICTGTRSSSI